MLELLALCLWLARCSGGHRQPMDGILAAAIAAAFMLLLPIGRRPAYRIIYQIPGRLFRHRNMAAPFRTSGHPSTG